MSLFRRILRRLNPLAALGDLGEQLATPYPHRFKVMGVAAMATVGLFSVMWQEGGAGLPHPPKITYVQSFDPNRSDAVIIAGNIEATRVARAAAAEQAARAERVREVYKSIGRISGMDVDAIEARAKADAAAQATEAAQTPISRVERDNP